MMKRLALAVMASSLLFACGGDEGDGDQCTIDQSAVCAGRQCGSAVTTDSCGASKTIDCGTCGEGLSCVNNLCISSEPSTCEITEEIRSAACADKCGTVSALNTCNEMQNVECGLDCGEGKTCNTSTKACVNEEDCALSDDVIAATCLYNTCGGAKATDNCNNPVYLTCENASSPIDLLDLFKENKLESGDYSGGVYLWDEEGTYLAAITQIPGNEPESEDFIAILFKASIELGTTVKISPMQIVDGYYECLADACILSSVGDNRFQALDGTVKFESNERFVVTEAPMESLQSNNCVTAPFSFAFYFEPPNCEEVDLLAPFAGFKDTDGNYEAGLDSWDREGTYFVSYLEVGTTEQDSQINYLVFKSTLSSDQAYQLSQMQVVDGYFVCQGDACILSNTNDIGQMLSKSGTVTITELADGSLSFALKDVVMTSPYYENCDTPAMNYTMISTVPSN